MMICIPSATILFEIASPIPLEAPDINAVLSCHLFFIAIFSYPNTLLYSSLKLPVLHNLIHSSIPLQPLDSIRDGLDNRTYFILQLMTGFGAADNRITIYCF